jgi:hypothetical protein
LRREGVVVLLCAPAPYREVRVIWDEGFVCLGLRFNVARCHWPLTFLSHVPLELRR